MNQMKTINSKIKTVILFAGLLCVGFMFCFSELKAADEVPRIVFENIRETADHLYVTKTVESADERYPAPVDTEFSFTLKLNGSLAENYPYRVFDQNGTEVLRYEGGVAVPYQTDRSGTFALKAGQTALFEHVGTGKSYEITEFSAEKFEQLVPAGGSAAIGTTLSDGVSVEFVNQYIPVTPEQQMTSIAINKRIAFPESYEVPESPEFTFLIMLEDKPYGFEDYTVSDTLTGVVKGTGITDPEGRFTLKAGETAVFENIEVGKDYEISEQSMEGWWTVGADRYEGATQAPLTLINFTNACASFGVMKTLRDGTVPDIDFTFQLTGSMSYAIAGAKYYLYQADGRRADDVEYETEIDGTFLLKPGQTAIFFGIEPGTVYNVSEEANPEYIQRVPVGAEGYRNKEVSHAVEILPFVNEKSESGALTVTKLVESESGDMPLEAEIFTFQLLIKEGDGTYVPVADEVYSIEVGNNVTTYRTEVDGKFTLKQNETARFEYLSQGETYLVLESELPEGYEIDPSDMRQEGTLTDQLNFTFINIYKMRLVDLYIHKRGEDSKKLPGAVFELYEDEDLTNLVKTDLVSDADGNIRLEELIPGTYYLSEKKAPGGYRLLTNPIQIELLRDGDGLYTVIDGTEHRSTDDNESIYIEKAAGRTDAAHVTIVNYKKFTLPTSGGSGIIMMIVLALAGLGFASVVFIRNKKAVH